MEEELFAAPVAETHQLEETVRHAVLAGAGQRERQALLERLGVSFLQMCTFPTRCQAHSAVATAAAATAAADLFLLQTPARDCAPVACRRR